MPTFTGSSRPPKFAAAAAVAVAMLIVAGGLYPFVGWRDPGLPPWSFLPGDWPRYWTRGDVIVNVLAYLPFGALLATALAQHLRRLPAFLLATVACAALSMAVEMTQHYLPSRIPARLDLLCNVAGGATGALLAAYWGQSLLAFEQRLAAALVRVPHPTSGTLVAGLWVLAQLSPETLFTVTGDLRRVLAGAPWPAAPLAYAATLEVLAVAAHVLAIALLLNRLFGSRSPALATILLVLLAGAAGKTLVMAAWLSPADAFDWLTGNVVRGLLFGSLATLMALLLSGAWMRRIAVAAVLAGCVAVNLQPETPYRSLTLASWQLGPYLNLNGLMRWLSTLWPLAALLWLATGRWQRTHWRRPLIGP